MGGQNGLAEFKEFRYMRGYTETKGKMSICRKKTEEAMRRKYLHTKLNSLQQA